MGNNQPSLDSLLNQTKYRDEMICKGQELYQVSLQNMIHHPFHKCIGAFLSYTDDGREQCKGTASAISSNILITVGHNLFSDKQRKIKTKNHRFYPGVNGPLQKYYQVECIYYPEQYQMYPQSVQYDYALIKLKQKITQISPQQFLCLAFDFDDKDAFITLFGYPRNDNYKPTQNKEGSVRIARQKGLERAKRIRKIEEYVISYEMSSQPGQSGSPVTTGPNKNIIIGLHKGGRKEEFKEYNIGRYVNINLILRMEVWREDCKGEKFKVLDCKTYEELDLNSRIFKAIKKMYKTCQSNLINEIKKNTEEIRAHREENRKLQKQIQSFNNNGEVNLNLILKEYQKMKQDIIGKKAELYNKFQELRDSSSLTDKLQKELTYCKQQNKKFQEELKKKDQIINCLKDKNIYLENQNKKMMSRKVSLSLIDEEYYQKFIEKINSTMINRGGNSIDARSILQDCLPILNSHKSSFMFEVIKYQGRHQVCLGVQCHTKNYSNIERHGQKSARTAMDESRNSGQAAASKKICFVPENGQFEMVVDFAECTLTFKDLLDNKFYQQAKAERRPIQKKPIKQTKDRQQIKNLQNITQSETD